MGTGIMNPFLAVATEKGRYNTVTELKADTTLKVDDIVRTIGTNTINDGISTTYIIKADNDLNSDGKNIQLNNGLWGIHIPQQGTDYKILESGTDCNNLTQPGTYIRQSGSIVMLNAPVNSAGYFIIYSMTEISTAIFQVFYEAHTHKMYTRSKSGDQWIEWKKMEMDDSLYSKKNDEYKIEYQEIGNRDTPTDILAWAETVPMGFYRSISLNNLFTNLPNNKTKGAFELEVGSISDNDKYRTLKLKDFESNVFVRSITEADPRNWSQLFSTSNCTIIHLGAGAGWAYFPNGLKLQWGAVDITPNTNSYSYIGNYHVPFTSSAACFCTRTFSNHSPSELDYTCWTRGIDGYKIYIDTPILNAVDTYWWFAIGY